MQEKTEKTSLNVIKISTKTTPSTLINNPTTTLFEKTTTTSLMPLEQLLLTQISKEAESQLETSTQESAQNFQPYNLDRHYMVPRNKKGPFIREKILTFCTKETAIRDQNNLIVACGSDLDIWLPVNLFFLIPF